MKNNQGNKPGFLFGCVSPVIISFNDSNQLTQRRQQEENQQDLRNITKYTPSVGANGIRPNTNSVLFNNLRKSC
ncbi:hypothetical protein [Hydrocoleum sp. CS-953]|uniref:hypothetical protein n=1 Tax=Hydrocoleum sp. CS-953 TaxID=1671698 RepID=UPI001179B868|nr:hypothetical protein [Hydrocoleum sp. CS-953]